MRGSNLDRRIDVGFQVGVEDGFRGVSLGGVGAAFGRHCMFCLEHSSGLDQIMYENFSFCLHIPTRKEVKRSGPVGVSS